jgi:hypothetical protein
VRRFFDTETLEKLLVPTLCVGTNMSLAKNAKAAKRSTRM